MPVRNNPGVHHAQQPRAPQAPACEDHKLGGADVSLRGGKLTVKGTANADDIKLERVDERTVRLTVNGESRDFANVKKADIRAGKGDDTIDLDPKLGIDLKVNGGKGSDTVNARRAVAPEDSFDGQQQPGFSQYANGRQPRVQIRGGAGADEINSDFDYARLLGGHGDDTITNGGNDARVLGGRGNDTLINEGIRADVRGGRGRDLIVNAGLGSRLRGGRGDDQFINEDPAARIQGGRGRDEVQDVSGTARIRSAQRVDELS